MKISTKRFLYIFIPLFLVLAGVFYVYDLEISLYLVNRESRFGHFFEAVGEWPNSFCMSLSAAVLCSLRRKEGICLRTLLYGIACALGWGIILRFTLRYAWHIRISPLILVPASLAMAAVTIWFFNRISLKKLSAFKGIAVVGLLLSFASIIAVNVVKQLWGRQRFRDMTDPHGEFTQWLFPQGMTGNRSFPSGHTANASTSVILTLFADHTKRPVKKVVCYLLPAAIISAVAVSRVIFGAHFASDVLFGAGINIALFITLKYFFYNTERKNKF